MHFHYDPILGLQYTCSIPYIQIDLDAIPKHISNEEILSSWYSMGILLKNSNELGNAITPVLKITSNIT